MTKPELISALVSVINADGKLIQRQAVKDTLDALSVVLAQQLAQHGKAVLPEVATFTRVERPARQGRNPRTGEAVAVAAKTVIKAKPVKLLADRVGYYAQTAKTTEETAP